jgi:hypothetical protein
MPANGANGAGRFSVELEVANNDDLALLRRRMLPPDEVRRETIQGFVDSGATKLVLPQAVVERLGLPLGDPVKVRYADGRQARRREVKGVFVQLLGRDGTFTAISEPNRETAYWCDRARRPRSARGLRGPAGRPPRSPRRDSRNRVNGQPFTSSGLFAAAGLGQDLIDVVPELLECGAFHFR